MGSVRVGRVNDELMKTLAELLRTVKDPRVSGLVSIVRVETSPDLGSAKVYVSVMGDEKNRRDSMKGIKSASGYLRRETAKRLRLRYTPELLFVEDDSIGAGTHIMEIIENVAKSDDKKRKLDVSGVAEFLKTRDDILILTHRSPDGDAIGSAAALALVLSSLGKKAYLFENPEMSARLYRRARPYLAPEDFVPKCIVAVDTADKKLVCEGAESFADSVDLVIDHHITHKSYARRECVVADAAACGEIIFEIAKALNVKLIKKLADLIYLAITTDTGRFLHQNTTAKTHTIAAELMAKGVDFEKINREFLVEKSRERIALEAELLSDIKFCFGGRVAVIKLTDEMVKRTKATKDDLESISALARVAKGVNLGIYIHEKNGAAKVSLRSDEKVNAAEFCAYFGGGGHERAAGCTLDCSVSEAEERVIARISELELF